MRTILLNEIAMEVIRRHPKKSGYVFDLPNRHQQDLLMIRVIQVKKRTGIDFHLHLLRHYLTTSLVEKGVDFIRASALLAHSRTMTSLFYSHTNGRKRKAVDLLED